MSNDFLPPEKQEGEEKDLLEQLLVVAAEKAAKQEADNALKKGFVTREQINQALETFGEALENRMVEKITSSLLPQVQEFVQKATVPAGQKKSTVLSPEDERDADPLAYILKKAREAGPDGLDDVDKQIIWGLTYKALSDKMVLDEKEQ